MTSKINCHVVSLADSNTRREAVLKNLNENDNIVWRFFDAKLPQDDRLGLLCSAEEQIHQYGRELTPGEIACFLSHFTLLSGHAASKGWIMILEDDVWLDPDFDPQPTINFAEARGLGFVRLFARQLKPAKLVGELDKTRQVIRFKSDPYGTQAYLISSAKAKAFVSSVKSIARPIDDELGRFWVNGLLPLAIFPFPCVERSVPSVLENDRVSTSRSRVSVLSLYTLNRIKEKIKKIVYNNYTVHAKYKASK